MQIGQYELAVAIPRDGRAPRIREYGHNGLTYVEGREGQPFSVIFRNNSPSRVMAIVSIDGLDVIDGQPATGLSRGYIVNAYSSTEIKGWRTSLAETRQFFFQAKDRSYSAETNQGTANCGVIACKVLAEVQIPTPPPPPPSKIIIRERYVPYPVYPWPYPPLYSNVPCGTDATYGTGDVYGKLTCSTEGVSSGNTLSAGQYCATVKTSNHADFTLGTGWGSAQTDHVYETTFARGLELATLSIYYTDAENLRRIGIVLGKDVAVAKLPEGFASFCRPPGC